MGWEMQDNTLTTRVCRTNCNKTLLLAVSFRRVW